MKVKVFWDESSVNLENEINVFIQNKKVIDIKFSTDAPSGDYSSFYNALVMYEEKGESEKKVKE